MIPQFRSISRSNALKLVFRAFRGGHVWAAIVGYAIGLCLVLFTLQLYLTMHEFFESGKASNYLILTKEVTLLNTATGVSAAFTQDEIEDLRRQPFVKQVGAFESNHFAAWTYGNKTLPLSTELFFEAVPDHFLDVEPPNWQWREGDPFVPVVVSKEFLNLYNFGYALAKGLPQITPDLVSMAPPLPTKLYGPAGQLVVQMKVVGFSERIPSILVPMSFMRWANQHLAGEAAADGMPARLLVKVTNSGDPRLLEYLKQKGWEVNRSQLQTGRLGTVALIAMSALGLVGLVFMILAFLVFVLAFRATLLEKKPEVELLLLLGYEQRFIEAHFLRQFARMILLVLLLSAAGLVAIGYGFADKMEKYAIELQLSLHPLVLLAALVLTAATFLLNQWALRRIIEKIEK
ncbi:hypothetical protein FHS56_000898 [Thermonema lapsum]|uniref:ABC3 transporter permease C-terminal domain-containing protein n=1 Tax=Thermonema lapsum TaxID=28195 RepID=A0A846MPW2_9BACT|nr:FtsX-like permease family protein [Thermonema lapsum]NIK73412.1 hypothetical protein [Thermonema lapsum]